MIGVMLLIALVLPVKWSIRAVPVNTPETCWSAHLVRLHSCSVQYPDSTSLQRAVCDADSAGQYISCIGGIE